MDRIGNKICTQFLSTCEKCLFFFIFRKKIFTGIKLVFLFRCQVGKVNFVCLPLFKIPMGIDTFVFQCPLAEAVKCAAYLPFGSFRFIHGIHLLSQPRKRVEFPLS
ncbi:DNA-directed RNA polymerase specialized sigma subunit [Streptococcus dysgalactiae subsp. equisimilis RE378]|nr:DNA-directed RNA polymerase specialized sigma subunit [Streptococcus dysgalactiae subsp. equisimilis RE378]